MSKAAVKAVKNTSPIRPKAPKKTLPKVAIKTIGGGGNGVGTSYGLGQITTSGTALVRINNGGISKTDKVEIFPYDVTELDLADNVKKRREFGWRLISRNGKNIAGNKGFNTGALARKGAVRALGEGARALMVDVKDA